MRRQERTFHRLNAFYDEEERLERGCLERMPRDALAVGIRILASTIQAEKQRLAYARVEYSRVVRYLDKGLMLEGKYLHLRHKRQVSAGEEKAFDECYRRP